MSKALWRVFLALTGWKPSGPAPRARKYVMIAAPHTSNWDYAFMMAICAQLGVRIHFLAKHTLFRWPMGPFVRAFGGIPVDRRSAANRVDVLAKLFADNDDFVLVVPAEGTRKKGQYWKSGFYRIAERAGVPLAFGWLDYEKRQGGIEAPFSPSGDIKRDMDRVREFYRDIKGKYPENFTFPRLKEEDGEDPSRAQA